jgi:hypothetical protein
MSNFYSLKINLLYTKKYELYGILNSPEHLMLKIHSLDTALNHNPVCLTVLKGHFKKKSKYSMMLKLLNF